MALRQAMIDRIVADYAVTRNKVLTAQRLGIHRDTVYKYTTAIQPPQTVTVPVTDAKLILSMDRMAEEVMSIARSSLVFKRPGNQTYLLTAAQNNTAIHEGFWANLRAYAEHLDARIMVGGFMYRKDAQGQRGQEKDTEDGGEIRATWDPRLDGYRADAKEQLAGDLVWMGQMNALPTNVDPLAGLTGYSRGDSAIYPHVKVAMRSVPTAPGTEPKLLYTTGSVTVPNYIQRKAGQVAEHHHVIGALVVEVEGDVWFARQINACPDGSFQDLDARVAEGRVTDGHAIYAVNWGDVHERKLKPTTETAMVGILEQYRPKYQFFHDLVDAETANPHTKDDHLQRYQLVKLDRDDVREELEDVDSFLHALHRPGTVSVVVPSNHDDMIVRWLKSQDHKKDPRNMRFYHEASLAALDQIDAGHGVDLLKWYLGPRNPEVLFLPPNRPTFILKGIEFGQHGHIGPNGNRRPSAKAYAALAVKVNKGHEHTAAIVDGVYVAGVMELEHGYNIGYSSWSRTLIFTYENGKRSLITMRGLRHRGATR